MVMTTVTSTFSGKRLFGYTSMVYATVVITIQPDEVRQNGDDDGGIDHRGVAEQPLAREGRGHLGEDAERRQDQDVDLRMPPDPDEVHIHHRIAAEIIGEEVGAD